jgi:hypothetical protein
MSSRRADGISQHLGAPFNNAHLKIVVLWHQRAK